MMRRCPPPERPRARARSRSPRPRARARAQHLRARARDRPRRRRARATATAMMERVATATERVTSDVTERASSPWSRAPAWSQPHRLRRRVRRRATAIPPAAERLVNSSSDHQNCRRPSRAALRASQDCCDRRPPPNVLLADAQEKILARTACSRTCSLDMFARPSGWRLDHAVLRRHPLCLVVRCAPPDEQSQRFEARRENSFARAAVMAVHS